MHKALLLLLLNLKAAFRGRLFKIKLPLRHTTCTIVMAKLYLIVWSGRSVEGGTTSAVGSSVTKATVTCQPSSFGGGGGQSNFWGDSLAFGGTV